MTKSIGQRMEAPSETQSLSSRPSSPIDGTGKTRSRLPQGGHEYIADMVPEIYADVPPAAHGAAARSLLAALIYLVESGRVRCDGTADEKSRFFMS